MSVSTRPRSRLLRHLVPGAVLLVLGTPTWVGAQLAEHPGVQEALVVAETWLEAQQAYEQIPSFSAAIVHDQERVWDVARGLAHPAEGVAATPETLYSICSISKLFTSVAVLQLRDEGRLELNDPVADHLPWFDLEQRWAGSPPVTIAGVLTHSAGLPRESNHPYWSQAHDFEFPTREEIIDGLADQETLYPSRTYFQYSNLGLTLAGEIVRERSGMDYHDYVRERILTPLGMDDTFSDIPVEHRGGRLATGYSAPTRDGKREPVLFFQARGIAPAAGFASTARDLARFASWQFRLTGDPDQPVPPTEVLHPHTLAEMQRVHYVDPEFDTYWGLGFSVNRRDGETFVGHGGSCPGFRSQLVLQKERKVGVAFMANAMVSAGSYAYGLYDLVAEALEKAAEDEGEATETDPELADFVGTYSRQPWGQETAVVVWQGKLALLGLPTGNPREALETIERREGDTFHFVLDDGEAGPELIFERDDEGAVTGYRVHGNLSPRVR